MELPLISEEQTNILNEISINNVIVNACAGAGKTSTNLFIATNFPELNILLLTYNKKLKLETRQKIDLLELTNIETHSFHSFGVKYYNHKCFTDTILKKIIKQNSKPLKQFQYDIIILDESQDISPLYFELICKIYSNNTSNTVAKICILGDIKQSIFEFNNADARFIEFADELFNLNSFNWSRCTLSESFRITHEMSEFINNSMLQQTVINSNKLSYNKPRYIICDTFCDYGTSSTLNEVRYYLNMGFQPYEIFILAPSIKNNKHPIRILENLIKTNIRNIPIYVPCSDEEELDKDILENKLVLSTFHQTKGLERKVVIVFNFDNSYFQFYKKNKNPNVCPNELYVVTTRALEHLSVFHHYKNQFLPFLERNTLRYYVQIIYNKQLRMKSCILNERSIETPVTTLTKHIPEDILDECINYLQLNTINRKRKIIDIPVKTKQGKSYESVSEITGIAIPAYFEYKLHGRMDIFNELYRADVSAIPIDSDGNSNNEMAISDSSDNETDTPSPIHYNLKTIDLDNISVEQLLYIANRWASYMSGYIFKICQITDYTWLTTKHLNRCIKRINKLNISQESAIFERKIVVLDKIELLNRELIGFIDCVDVNNIYEFKCVKELKKTHYLQLAIYMYMYETVQRDNNNFSDRHYYLYNILTHENIEISCDYNKLKQMIEFLIFSKNNKNIISNTAFKLNAQTIKNKYT
jgi:hypothetical protein